MDMQSTLADVYKANIKDAEKLLEILKDSKDLVARQRVLLQLMDNVEKLKALEEQKS